MNPNNQKIPTYKLPPLHIKQKELLPAIKDDSIKIILLVCGRQWGKTRVGMSTLMYYISKPNTKVMWVSHNDSHCVLVYKEILKALRGKKVIIDSKMGSGDCEIRFINQSYILFRSAKADDNLRGPPGGIDILFIDEAAFIKEDTYWTVLNPMLLVRGKKTFLMTTPKGKNWIYKYASNSRVKYFHYTIYDNPLLTPEQIQETKDSVPELVWRQEYLAEFIDKANLFHNIDDILTLQPIQTPLEKTSYYFGIDVGLSNDSTIVTVCDEFYNLVNFYEWRQINTNTLIEEILKVYNIWKPKKSLIEQNGLGKPIYDILKPRFPGLESFITSNKSKIQIITELVMKFETKKFKAVNDDRLRIQLNAFIGETKDGVTRFQADYGHDDIVMSLAICHEGVAKKIQYVPPTYRTF